MENNKQTVTILLAILALGIATFFVGRSLALRPVTVVLDDTSRQSSAGLGGVNSISMRHYESSTATTSPTFFGIGGTLTPTTTILTITDITDIDTVALNIQMNASTSGSVAYILPQVSIDGIDWYEMSDIHIVGGSTGGAVNTIALSSASSTFFVYAPGSVGFNRTQLRIDGAIARQMRFRAWVSVASSSLWVQAVEQVRNAR